ncbi:MAG: hypothetical protein ACI9J3_003046 [Parvicellaceae bacterium]|jgi:hypothetical protein
MKYLLIILLSIPLISFGQPIYNWEANVLKESAIPKDLLIDSKGATYICSNILLDSGKGLSVVKHDQDGVFQWEVFDTMQAIYIEEAIIDDDDIIHLVGHVEDSLGNRSCYLTSISSFGVQMWSAIYDGASSYQAGCLGVCFLDDHIYATGLISDSTSFAKVILLKYDMLGNEVWAITDDMGSLNTDVGYDVATDGTDILVTGVSNFASTGPPEANFFLCKYAVSGSQVWLYENNFTSGKVDYGSEIAIDSDKNVFVSLRYSDHDLVKIDSAGIYQWTHNATPNLPGFDAWYHSVKIDENNSIYLLGEAGVSTPSGDAGTYLFSRVDQAGNLIYNHASSTYGYAYDFTILANGNIAVLGDKDSVTRIMFGYDSSGVELWEINYSNDEDRAWCYFVQSDDSSNITIAGIQRDSMSGPNLACNC